MLRVNKLPEVLRGALQDGVEGCVLMTSQGSALGSEFKNGELSETVLAAISSSMWNNYSCVPASEGLTLQIVKLERGTLGISKIGNGYLIAAYGSNVALGMLRLKLEALSAYFTRVFDQLK